MYGFHSFGEERSSKRTFKNGLQIAGVVFVDDKVDGNVIATIIVCAFGGAKLLIGKTQFGEPMVFFFLTFRFLLQTQQRTLIMLLRK